jgi:hypothetical protein
MNYSKADKKLDDRHFCIVRELLLKRQTEPPIHQKAIDD